MDVDSERLWILRRPTLDLADIYLNTERVLKCEDGTLRDYRGLIEPAKLSDSEKERVKASKDSKQSASKPIFDHF